MLIDEKEGIILKHQYYYHYWGGKEGDLKYLAKITFERMVFEMMKSVEDITLRKMDYEYRLILKIIPKEVNK
jgi:hypothetical protein